MSSTKIQGKFYPLQHEEFLNLNRILTQSELSVYLWLKTNDPFGEKLMEADTQEIAKDLGISRRSIQRALVKLREENLIDLVINKFKYRMKSKSLKIEGKSEVATPMSPDDIKIAQTTSGSSQRHPCRSNDTHVAKVSPVSPSSSETQSGTRFQNSKTNKTYLDFKDSLSEGERENFLKFVEEETNNLERPINDLEAWLASKTKAQQNRWEVYYQIYQKQQNSSSPQNSDSNSVSTAEKNLAISRWQEHLQRQKLAAEAQERPSEPRNPQTAQATEQNSSNHNRKSPDNHLTETVDQIINNPETFTKDTALPKSDSSQRLKITVNQGLDILRDLEMTQQLENSQGSYMGGEKS